MADGVNALANLLGKVNSNNALVVALDGGVAAATTFVGPAADNTAAVPFTFTSDGNTGLGSSAADTVNLITGGTSRVTVSTTAVTSTVRIAALGSNIFGTHDGSLIHYVERYDSGSPYAVFQSGSVNNGVASGWLFQARDASGGLSDTFKVLYTGLASTVPVSILGGITAAGATGVPVVVAVGRVTAQSAANASISTFTVGAADASFEISGNMNVTASTTLTTTLTCTYTDETNTARSMILPVSALAGSFIAAGAITGSGATVWSTPVMHIRCKAATVITILTSAGTFTGVTYTAEGVIKQTK